MDTQQLLRKLVLEKVNRLITATARQNLRKNETLWLTTACVVSTTDERYPTKPRLKRKS